MIVDTVFRELTCDDEARAAAVIERECLTTAWSFEQIKNLPEYACYVGAFDNNILCGIASMYAVAGEGQVMNIAVSHAYRRNGIAFGLMDALIKKAVEAKCENITLEVAEDNYSAISLYEKCGFATVGKRNGFYNGKNALIMEKKL